jgi:hypothetical protein
MKKSLVSSIIFSVLLASGALSLTRAQDVPAAFKDLQLPFYVYHGFHARENHFAPSGWMGDYGDIRFSDNFKDPKSQKPVIQVTYTGKGSKGNGWAGIYWQNPPNNWGSRNGGFNLNGAKKVLFNARGEKGGEIVSQFKIGGISGNFSDSGSAAVGPVTLTKEWKPYEISLEGQELSSISGGFCWTMTHDDNPDGATFYLDDIRYE